MVIYDGQSYNNDSDIPDFGSWKMVHSSKNEEGKILRDYYGLQADVDNGKLALINYVNTGSTAVAIDTGNVYIYEETNSEWKQFGA